MGLVKPIEGDMKAVPSIEPLVHLVNGDMQRVNQLIVSKAGSDVAMIPEVANHLISSGGKRLRPMLTLAAAQMCGYAGDGHIALATAVEFMHTATLLHDDVVDESDMRRGKPAARKVWGNQASVLVGDYLLGQAFRMMVDVGVMECLGILSDAAAVIAEGEVMQLAAAKRMTTTEADYLAVIKAKTAALFSAAAEVGPVLAVRPRDEQTALSNYGIHLGYAFQLVDDALDYGGSSAALGKNVGDDFREGKVTLPVLIAYQRGNEADRAFWQRCIAEGDIRDGDLEAAIDRLKATGAIAGTIERAVSYGEVAKANLDAFPDSAHKHALIEVVDFCISRVS